jgi:enoyl-CoA hydratase
MRDGTLLYREMLRAPVPVVVACCGHALAAGALLLLADDVTVGLRGPFKIGLNEVAIGVPMPRFAMVMAEHRLPPHRRPVSVLGAQIGDTDQAYTNGFVDIVVDDDLLGRALGEAARLRDLDRTAFSVTKRRLNRALLEELDLLKGAGL